MTTDAAPTSPTSEPPAAHEFRAEIRQLLNILAHSLYTEREIFLRELISNASDALHRVQFEMLTQHDVLSPEAELAIRITVDAEQRVLRVSDSGIGMTREELIDNLGTIAHSGVLSFLEKARDLPTDQKPAADLIGQFGVGFYSAFMVADEVRVTSRSFRGDAPAHTWISRGDTYTVEPAERAERGTTVALHLKEDTQEFLQAYRLEQTVKKHSNFVPFPIYLEGRSEPVNQRQALWRRAPREVTPEQYEQFYKELTLDFEKPRLSMHVSTDAPVQVYAVLFVPARREKGLLSVRQDHGLKLYSKKVLIQEYHKDLLPNYFRFVEGVVDSEDLPLNISRETVQGNRVVERLRGLLTRRVQSELEQLAREKPEAYAAFWREFGTFVKEGVATQAGARDELVALLRFPSSHAEGDGLVSLQDYVERMPADQPAIYFALGSDLKSVTRSPHLDPLRQRRYEVLYWVDTIDHFLPVVLREVAGKPLRNVEDAGQDLPATPPAEPEAQVPEDAFAQLLARCQSVLGERVLEVRASTHLTDSPARLVSPAGSAERDLQRVRRLIEQDYVAPKKIFELNRGHALVRNLAGLVAHDGALVDLCIEQLYADALLVEGLHPDPAEMVGRIQQLMEAATGGSGQQAAGSGE